MNPENGAKMAHQAIQWSMGEICGLAVNLAVQVLCIPLAGTAGWMSIARAVELLAG